MYFIMTIDVESYSFSTNRETPEIVELIYKFGLPHLLNLLAKHDVCGTFYFTGMFAEQSPSSIDLVKEYGHEIGCHGYDHSPNRALDMMSFDEQVAELKKAKNVIEDIFGRIYDFRAPALRINEYTIRALEQTGFNTDSSIASQRFDGPFTFGSRKKLKWLIAPRHPYYPSYDSIVKKGRSKILEIPISALIFPYIGTTMRVSPLILKILEKFLFKESARREKPIVFLFHPNECLDAKHGIMPVRRANNAIEYLFADAIRHRLKIKNLGIKAAELLENVIHRAKRAGFEFITVQKFKRIVENYGNI